RELQVGVETRSDKRAVDIARLVDFDADLDRKAGVWVKSDRAHGRNRAAATCGIQLLNDDAVARDSRGKPQVFRHDPGCRIDKSAALGGDATGEFRRRRRAGDSDVELQSALQ